MKTILIVVGKTTDARMQQLEEEYIKRVITTCPSRRR